MWHESFFELFHRFNKLPTQTWSGKFEDMVADGLAVAGSAATVAAKLGEQLRITGANYLVSHLVFGDMTLADSLGSVELFAERVMPALATGSRETRTLYQA